jgi:hypothetical protein
MQTALNTPLHDAKTALILLSTILPDENRFKYSSQQYSHDAKPL